MSEENKKRLKEYQKNYLYINKNMLQIYFLFVILLFF